MSKLCVNKKDCLDFFPFNFHEFILGIVNRFIFYFISKRSLCQKVNCNNQASAFLVCFEMHYLYLRACLLTREETHVCNRYRFPMIYCPKLTTNLTLSDTDQINKEGKKSKLKTES